MTFWRREQRRRPSRRSPSLTFHSTSSPLAITSGRSTCRAAAIRAAAGGAAVLLGPSGVGGGGAPAGEVAAGPAGTVGLEAELALNLHETPDPHAVGSEVGLDIGGRLCGR